MFLLNSQDGGILTVSVSQGNPETASFVPGDLVTPPPSAHLWTPRVHGPKLRIPFSVVCNLTTYTT